MIVAVKRIIFIIFGYNIGCLNRLNNNLINIITYPIKEVINNNFKKIGHFNTNWFRNCPLQIIFVFIQLESFKYI